MFAAALAVTERRNPSASSWEVTPWGWKGILPRDPASGYVLRPGSCTEPCVFAVPAGPWLKLCRLAALESPGSCGKRGASQPGCRAPSCSPASKISAPTQKGLRHPSASNETENALGSAPGGNEKGDPPRPSARGFPQQSRCRRPRCLGASAGKTDFPAFLRTAKLRRQVPVRSGLRHPKKKTTRRFPLRLGPAEMLLGRCWGSAGRPLLSPGATAAEPLAPTAGRLG